MSDRRRDRVLTRLNDDLLDNRTLGEVTELVYNSSFDGQEIQGWYITPPDFDPERKYPLILEIHGGPHLAYGSYFSAEMQLMADGYPVYPIPIGMNIISDQLLYCWFSYYTKMFWAPIGTLQVRGDTEDEEALDYDQAFAEPTQDGKKIFEMSTAGIGVVTVGLMVAILSFD